jgi:diphthine-ammonia ligase
MKVVALWSGGKDSSLACYKAMKDAHDVALIVTFIWERPSLAHSLSLIKLQSEACRKPLFEAKVKEPYFDAYRETISELSKEYGIEAVVTGDISYVDSFHGNWIDDVCNGTGVEVIKPLWGLNRSRILEELITNGFKIIFTCAKQPWFTEEWLGRTLDRQCVKDLRELNEKYGVDMCGEMGEYHTMTLDAPMFSKTVQISEFKRRKIDNAFILEPIRLSLAAK